MSTCLNCGSRIEPKAYQCPHCLHETVRSQKMSTNTKIGVYAGFAPAVLAFIFVPAKVMGFGGLFMLLLLGLIGGAIWAHNMNDNLPDNP